MRLKLGIFFLLLSMTTLIHAQNTSKNEIPVYTEKQLGIAVTAKQPEFSIKLKSNPTTGYSWFLREFDDRLMTPVKHQFEAPQDKKLIGAPGFEVWTFRMKPAAFTVPQQAAIRFVYARPWEGSDQSTQVVFRVSTGG